MLGSSEEDYSFLDHGSRAVNAVYLLAIEVAEYNGGPVSPLLLVLVAD